MLLTTQELYLVLWSDTQRTAHVEPIGEYIANCSRHQNGDYYPKYQTDNLHDAEFYADLLLMQRDAEQFLG